jgi:hypothetical protein
MKLSDLFRSSAAEFLQFAEKDKKVKVMSEPTYISQNLFIVDISLHKGGPAEDRLYLKSRKYYCNIKRGNSLLVTYSQNDKKIEFIRRGFRKFFDMTPAYT